MNPILRLLCGSGRIREPLRGELTAAGLVLLEEGLTGSIAFRHYRGPHCDGSDGIKGTTGSIAVTPYRLVVWTGRHKHIDVPLGGPPGPRTEYVSVGVDDSGRIVFGYDAARFHPDRRGTVRVRLRTPRAVPIAQLLSG